MTVRNGWEAGTDLFSYNRHFSEFGTINDPAWVIANPERARLIRAVAARQAIWGTPPPVEAFWSLTMYDVPDYYPVDNPIGRYGIAANWLPVPAGPFRPMLRLYHPRPEAFNDQQWRLPAIQRGG
jgi:hypothetical protein